VHLESTGMNSKLPGESLTENKDNFDASTTEGKAIQPGDGDDIPLSKTDIHSRKDNR